ncbi:MAG: NAD-dependent epimerase/dehydratase family protein [Nitrospirota bacterium]
MTTPLIRVLILGFGRLGEALARRHGNHYEMRGVRRTHIDSPPCGVYAMSLDDPRLVEHMAWADHLIFCPAAAPSSDLAAYRATYLDNMVSVTSQLTERRITPRSIILISSTGVYPESVDEPIDESYHPVIESERQEILLQTEHALIDSGLPYVIFRCGGLYGEGRDKFRSRLAEGLITSTMLTRQFVHFIHIHDVCDAIDLAIRRNLTAEVFNLVDDSQIRRVDFYQFVSTMYGLPIPDRGPAPNVAHDRVISNTKAKTRLGLTLTSPSITDYLRTTVGRA